jgi:cytochrome P450
MANSRTPTAPDELDALRDASNVYYGAESKRWWFTRFDDIREGIRDPRLSMDPRKAAPETGHRAMAPLAEMGSMAFLDPPDHTRLRRLVSHAFTPKFVESFRPDITALVDELLTGVATGPFDFANAVGKPLSRRVVACLFLGLAEKDLPVFLSYLGDASQIFNPKFPKVQALAARANLKRLWLQVLADRRMQRGHDFVSLLLDGQDDDRLSEDELVETLIMTFGAGNISTAEMINLAVLHLLEHPDQIEKLRQAPSLIPNAVEECLRFESPIMVTTRVAPENLELRGCAIGAGELVTFMTSVAARDPRVHPDPRTLDVTREKITHLAFGGGVHVCTGAALARLETELVLTSLLRHCPTLRLDPERAPERKMHGMVSGLAHLWVLP